LIFKDKDIAMHHKNLLKLLRGKDFRRFSLPLPTRVISNGEFTALPQTGQQRRVEHEILRLAERYGSLLGLTRRDFLRSACGMAAAFCAMNTVFEPCFAVDEAEAADPGAAAERAQKVSNQFIFDVQLHFVNDEYAWEGLVGLRRYAKKFNPVLQKEQTTLKKFKFENFVREVFLQSQTSLGLLSGAPSDKPENWFLRNDEIAEARDIVNSIAGSKRLYSHAIITPGQPGWLDEIDRAVEVLKPDSWKGYTIGDPLAPSRYPWRLDDEGLVYPAYEKMVKAGIRNVCIHKGLLPLDYRESFSETWRYAMVDDVGKAARDWPQLNFVIYHSALRPLQQFSGEYLQDFETSGYLPWVTELAAIPEKYGVSNVYAEIGTAFAVTVITHPRLCAAMLGQLVKGLGRDHVLWGTDSVWYGSPQWQIEAMRRLEIPEEMRNRFAFHPLGPATGATKNAILGENAARLYGLRLS
jgi:predicted TIM-barrel fold metal-dependent hydrolase